MDSLVTSLQNAAIEAPLVLRVVVGLLGAVVLLAGARLAKPALYMASFGVGATGAVLGLQAGAALAPALGGPIVLLVGACVGGLAVAVVARVAVKVALFAAGALTGVVATGAVATVMVPVVLPWWSVLVGALAGVVVVPLLARFLLRLAAAAVGAVLVAWALAMPTHPWLLLGLFVVGAAVQLGVVGGAPESKKEDG